VLRVFLKMGCAASASMPTNDNQVKFT